MFVTRLGTALKEGIVSGVILGLTGVDMPIPTRAYRALPKEEEERMKYKRMSERCENRHQLCNRAIAHYNNNELDDMSKCFGS